METDYDTALERIKTYVRKNKREQFSKLLFYASAGADFYSSREKDEQIEKLKKYCEDNYLCLTDYEIYGIGTVDYEDKLQFVLDKSDKVTREVFNERFELLEHINERLCQEKCVSNF